MRKKVYIIAEAGVNHNGNIRIAFQMIDAAKEAGVDAVKFQTFIPELGVSKFAEKAKYQKSKKGQDESQLDMVKKLALSFNDFTKILDYCNNKKINFMSTPFDVESIEFLNELGLETFKIPSGEIINLQYLRKIGSLNKKILLSTGMANLGEIERAIDVLVDSGTKREKIIILQCITNYPCPYEEANLKAMLTLKEAFKLPVGYSDHTLGIEVPIAAVAMGSSVIEKHFTLNRNMAGPDHKSSLEFDELKNMVCAIRNIEKALGNGLKKPNKSEINIMKNVRKSIVANCGIKKGEVFSEKNLAAKRPGHGISPMLWDKVIGRMANKNYNEDELISL